MLKSFFSKYARFGYNLFCPDQTKLAEKYDRAFSSLDQTFEQGLEKILNYFFPPTHIPTELRGLSGEAYTEAKKALDEKWAAMRKKDEELDQVLGLKVFLTPSHSIDAYSQRDKNFERLGKIAEKRGMDTIEFAKSLEGAKEYLADYVGWDKIHERSRAVGDEWSEIGKIDIFFELLEEGLTLPTSWDDMLVLHLLKSRDENKEMQDVDITVDDIRKYMGTPEFDKASIEFLEITEASKKRLQKLQEEMGPEYNFGV